MKKRFIIAIICILVLSMGGCFGKLPEIGHQPSSERYYPKDDEVNQFAEKEACGESIERTEPILFKFRSQERDLEFEVLWYENTVSPDGSFTQTKDGYLLVSDYSKAQHYFWQNKFEKAVDKHTYSYCFYPGCEPGNNTMAACGLQVYMDEDVSEEQIEDFEELMRQLRDICIKETAYHHNAESDFNYQVVFGWVDPKTLYIKNCETINITANSTDEELKVSEFKKTSEGAYYGPPKREYNGDAFICMYGSERTQEWEFYN